MERVRPHFHKEDRISEIDIIPDGQTVAVVPNWQAPEGTEVTYLASGIFRRYKMVDGTWRQVGSSFAHGVFTKNMADASAGQNIAHGLGVIPKFVEMTAFYLGGSTLFSCVGTYDGSTTKTIYTYPAPDGASSTTDILRLIPVSSNIQAATITVDATNLILAWTKTSSPTGNAYIHWKAYA